MIRRLGIVRPSRGSRDLQWTGDGDALPLPDGSHDICFSNGVIEHVRDWKKQFAFVREVRRVGPETLVHPPRSNAPRPHYLSPVIHYLKRSVQRAIIPYLTAWEMMERPSPDTIA